MKSVGKTSRYLGVTLYRSTKKYEAFVKVNGRRVHLGMWRRERDAAVARDRGVLHFGLDARLNLSKPSRKLGAATPEELRHLARATEKKASNTSAYFGVSYDSRRRRWAAIICPGQQRKIQIAQFDDPRDAAFAYDRVARFLGVGKLNFPKKRLRPASIPEIRVLARRLLKERTTSNFRGVCWDRRTQRWHAQIHVRHKNHHLGFFDYEKDAAHAYDRAAKRLHGRKATLNFA